MQPSSGLGRVDEALLEGKAWWCPWLAIFSACAAASVTLFVPAIRSPWILAVFPPLLVGAVGGWRGVFHGNAPQKVASVLGILMILGLSAVLVQAFFAVELGQGISSATSTTGITDY
ncbi:hypothetical protein [Phycisphaera mikurensis]|uniref:Uncharacterized protein n=1 Tax=Phycisphaera mikurensis (strain NBRC 102666 / KCTC 22515 / FYK2301M01) TaxID=1142394 RepID=I0ICD1_PHYMF|nr:hypothetical protein [Phycisphaera mikurensis]MBB6442203.1 hypothetical protein [Phycisphaera mikurensis]BAM02919.1 hypothetical protein PSMK_07600 [Phycisphaera mikurensis NBRC 102666]